MNNKYTLIRASRKSIGIRITPTGEIIVRAPRRVSEKEIDEAISRHADWISRTRESIGKKTSLIDSLDDAQIANLRQLAKKTFAEKVEKYSALMGVLPESISITGARSRYGSCSSKKRLSFSVFLTLYPDYAIDYVIVHELAHLTEMNHSKRFYAIVEKYLPDWQKRKEQLKPEYMKLPDELL